MQYQENPSICRDELEFFCVPLYTDYGSNFHKKFKMASIFDTNAEYKIWLRIPLNDPSQRAFYLDSQVPRVTTGLTHATKQPSNRLWFKLC